MAQMTPMGKMQRRDAMQLIAFRRGRGVFVAALTAIVFALAGPACAAGAGSLTRLQVAQAETSAEEMGWGLVRDSADPSVLERYLSQFPNSPHASEARAKLDALRDQGGTIVAAPVVVAADLPQSDGIALELQRELKRLGCYGGKLDGDWGQGSKRALSNFASAAGVSVGSQPTSNALTVVKAGTGRVCGKADTGGGQVQQSGGGCYDVAVTLDATNAQGTKWDPWPGSRGNPDPIVKELSTGASNTCVDSYYCSIHIEGAGGTMNFNLMDDDPDASDYIGAGQCKSGKNCRVGGAQLSMSRC